MRRILSIAMATVVAMAVIFAASVAASASNGAVQLQGGWLQESSEFAPNPSRCGPSGFEVSSVVTGIDTLGGTYIQAHSFCQIGGEQPNTFRNFDWTGTRSYFLTGEQGTLEVDEFVVIQDTVTCVRRPERPVTFTIDGYTGEHAGGRLIGLLNFVSNPAVCGGDHPPIIWYEGVFTPNAPRCGLGYELAVMMPVLVWLYRRRRLLRA